MPIEFHCSECYSQVITPDETAGKKGRCPNCASVIQIPTHSPQPKTNIQPVQPAKSKVIHPVGAKPTGDPFKPTGTKTSNAEYSEAVERQFGLDKWDEKKDEGAWGEDTELSYKMRKVVAKEQAQNRLAGPAQCLIVSATVNLIAVAIGVMALIAWIIYQVHNNLEIEGFWITIWVVVIGVVMMDATMIIIGGNHMRHARSYSMAYTGAVFALLPLNVLFMITIPFGFWAITTLNDPILAEGFKRR